MGSEEYKPKAKETMEDSTEELKQAVLTTESKGHSRSHLSLGQLSADYKSLQSDNQRSNVHNLPLLDESKKPASLLVIVSANDRLQCVLGRS